MKELQTAAKPPLGWIWGDFFSPWQRKFPSDSTLNANAQYVCKFAKFCKILQPPSRLPATVDDRAAASHRSRLARRESTNRPHAAVSHAPGAAYRNPIPSPGAQYTCELDVRQFGVQLTSEGVDAFVTPVDIEVQYADELSIAAIEK